MVATLDNPGMETLLSEQLFARLGCHAENSTYVVPISFAYDAPNHRIVGQTYLGQKILMMRKNPEVCIEVDDIRSLTHWRSVILWGRYEELEGAAAAHAMGILIDRYGPMFDEMHEMNRRGRDITPPHLHERLTPEVVYCVHVDHMTGRCEDGLR